MEGRRLGDMDIIACDACVACYWIGYLELRIGCDFQVTLDVQARKVVVDSAGVETPVPMDDWVEIGVFAPAEGGNGLGEPLYVQKHRIRSAKQTITVTVPRKPARAGIDPYHLLIDWEIDDNTDEVKVKS